MIEDHRVDDPAAHVGRTALAGQTGELVDSDPAAFDERCDELGPALLRFSGDARERTNDTRQLASQWVAGRIAPGSTVIVEHFGFDLLAQPWRFVFPLGKVGCVDARLMISGKAQYTAIDSGRGDRSNVDYGTLDPARADTCQADWAILTQYDRYAAERDRFPREYASYARLLAQGEIVATIAPEPGRIGGPIVRIIKLNR